MLVVYYNTLFIENYSPNGVVLKKTKITDLFVLACSFYVWSRFKTSVKYTNLTRPLSAFVLIKATGTQDRLVGGFWAVITNWTRCWIGHPFILFAIVSLTTVTLNVKEGNSFNILPSCSVIFNVSHGNEFHLCYFHVRFLLPDGAVRLNVPQYCPQSHGRQSSSFSFAEFGLYVPKTQRIGYDEPNTERIGHLRKLGKS